MTEFRKLLAEEQHPTVSKPEADIKNTCLPIRRTTTDFYEEYPIPKTTDAQTAPRKRPVIKRPKIRAWQRELWLKRMIDVDTPATDPLSPTSPIRIISAGEARFRKEITTAIAQQQAILNQQAPEASRKPLDRDRTIATWRRQLAPYQKQLKKSYDCYATAKGEWQAVENNRWQRMTDKIRKLEKRADALFYEFLEMLRFVVQALLHIVGLRWEPPAPIRPVLSEKQKPLLEHFKETHDAEFSVMADQKKLEPWLIQRFDNLIQARQRHIKAWNTAHTDEKNAAQHEIKRLSALLATKPVSPHLQITTKRQISIILSPSSSFGCP